MAAPMRLKIISALCNGEKRLRTAGFHRHDPAQYVSAPEHAVPVRHSGPQA
jgi:hypothetical protein